MTNRLRTESGAPVADNQNSQSAGPGGPLLLQDQNLIEKLARFNRERLPERVVHAVGSGGRAMEQMMKEGLIGAVFDYAMGEIADEMFEGLRAATPERLTVAGDLGLPQVICPGGCEHLGFLVEPNTVPEGFVGFVQLISLGASKL